MSARRVFTGEVNIGEISRGEAMSVEAWIDGMLAFEAADDRVRGALPVLEGLQPLWAECWRGYWSGGDEALAEVDIALTRRGIDVLALWLEEPSVQSEALAMCGPTDEVAIRASEEAQNLGEGAEAGAAFVLTALLCVMLHEAAGVSDAERTVPGYEEMITGVGYLVESFPGVEGVFG
ncbi:MAG: hypothetical protein ACE366_26100 [Bradymonadia bacterium]